MEQTHYILGVAGHVDHGKTALIRALTGVNTDRLKEEQERGISIELGFAELPLAGGLSLGVVDMPGHERFVRQMVAGAGGVDLALLVVAADEGVMPQTVEHLEILDSLDVRGGVVVLSKLDQVDDELVEVAREELLELLEGTFLEGRPVVGTSVPAGRGLDELRAALTAEAHRLTPRPEAPFRLPVDRVFTMPGAGAVVTGTCWSGRARPGDHLVVEPGGRKVRVRETQVHGRRAAEVRAGQRVALALHGLKKEDLARGDQVLAPGAATVTRRVDLRVNLFPRYGGSLRNRQRLHVHHAGREALARIVLLDAEELGGDGRPRTGLCQLHLEEALVARPGDRLVLRFYSPVTSIAGGVVLDVDPGRHRRFADDVLTALEVREQGDPADLLRQELLAAGLAGVERNAAAAGAELPEAVAVGPRLYHAAVLEREADAVAGLVRDHAQRYPLRLGISKEEVRRRRRFPGSAADWNALCQVLAPLGGWVVAGDRLALGPEGPPLPPELQDAVDRRERALRGIGLNWPGGKAFAASQPPLPAGGDRELREDDVLRHLVDHGRAVQVAPDYHVHPDALADLTERLRAHFASQDGQASLEFGSFRELSGLSRKLGIPMLEYLDGVGITRREGDLRRPGPRLAGVSADAPATGARGEADQETETS
ncbi:MAG: selenocysteine-specific translation elongation factor [Candidatus Krumholzibacteriia bacterium]